MVIHQEEIVNLVVSEINIFAKDDIAYPVVGRRKLWLSAEGVHYRDSYFRLMAKKTNLTTKSQAEWLVTAFFDSKVTPNWIVGPHKIDGSKVWKYEGHYFIDVLHENGLHVYHPYLFEDLSFKLVLTLD